MAGQKIKDLAEKVFCNYWDKYNNERRELLLPTRFQDMMIEALCDMYKEGQKHPDINDAIEIIYRELNKVDYGLSAIHAMRLTQFIRKQIEGGNS